eukprot:scaffold1734_cov113-Isochrysis_galbana.AAC.9
MLARRIGAQDITPYPALATQPDPSELMGFLPTVKPPPKPRSMAPVIILAQPAPVPLKRAVLPETVAKIPEAVLPVKSLGSGAGEMSAPPSAPLHAPVSAPPLVAPPMPLAPPNDSARIDEVLGWLQAVMRGSSKVGASRASRLHAAMCDRMDMFDAALSDPTRSFAACPAPGLDPAPNPAIETRELVAAFAPCTRSLSRAPRLSAAIAPRRMSTAQR